MNKPGKEQIEVPIDKLKIGQRYTFYTKNEVPTDEELEGYDRILHSIPVNSPGKKLSSSPKEKKFNIIRGTLAILKKNGQMKIDKYENYNYKTGEWEKEHGIYSTMVNDISKITQYNVGPKSGPTNDLSMLINSFIGGRKTKKMRKSRKVKKTRHTKKYR